MQATAVLSPRAPRIISFARMGDEALASRAAAGNNGAFAALYERYYEPLLGYCRSILLNAEDAHDATQSALENALRALPRREPGRPLKPWLYRIAHNEAINIVRRRQPVASGVDTDDLLTVPGPEVDSEQRTRLAQLVDDLRMLPERQRGALVMRELSGLSYDEIGLALGVSNEAARRAVFDARTALHDAARRPRHRVHERAPLPVGRRPPPPARPRRPRPPALLRRLRHLRARDGHAPDRPAHARAVARRRRRRARPARLRHGHRRARACSPRRHRGQRRGRSPAGGLGWAGLPVVVKGLAVAAVVATTGTAAVELPKAARQATARPRRRASAIVRRRPRSPPCTTRSASRRSPTPPSPAASAARAAPPAAAANARVRTSEPGEAAALADRQPRGAGRADHPGDGSRPRSQPTPQPAATTPATRPPAKTPEELAADGAAARPRPGPRRVQRRAGARRARHAVRARRRQRAHPDARSARSARSSTTSLPRSD